MPGGDGGGRKSYGVFYGGILVEVDEDMPPDVAEFRDGDRVIGRIVNIGTDEPAQPAIPPSEEP